MTVKTRTPPTHPTQASVSSMLTTANVSVVGASIGAGALIGGVFLGVPGALVGGVAGTVLGLKSAQNDTSRRNNEEK